MVRTKGALGGLRVQLARIFNLKMFGRSLVARRRLPRAPHEAFGIPFDSQKAGCCATVLRSIVLLLYDVGLCWYERYRSYDTVGNFRLVLIVLIGRAPTLVAK